MYNDKFVDGLQSFSIFHCKWVEVVKIQNINSLHLGKRVESENMTIKKANTNISMTNEVRLMGNVTFVKSYGKVSRVGLVTEYEDNGKTFKCTNVVKFFDSMEGVLNNGDLISVEGHFATSKYTDKKGEDVFTTDIIADSVTTV